MWMRASGAKKGKPEGQDGFRRGADMGGQRYTNRLVSGFRWDRADFYAVFQGDRLTSKG